MKMRDALTRDMSRTEILLFIKRFEKSEHTFTNGCCYWFTQILRQRFGGNTMYLPVFGHFIQEINGRLYDVTGDVTDKYSNADKYDWQTYVLADSSNYARIYHDCVLMEGD